VGSNEQSPTFFCRRTFQWPLPFGLDHLPIFWRNFLSVHQPNGRHHQATIPGERQLPTKPMPNCCRRQLPKHAAKKRDIIIPHINSSLRNMMPFNDPPKPTYHRHYESRRPNIYELERDGHMVEGREDHTGVHQQRQQRHWASWTGNNNHFFDGPPAAAISKSFTSTGSNSYSSHQLVQHPGCWPPLPQPNHDNYQHPYHRQLQHPPPPPSLAVSLQSNQAPTVHQGANPTTPYFHKPHPPLPLPPSSSEPSQLHFVYDLREADVLCGRGAPSNFHGGNRVFKDLVTQYQMSYLAARRHDKPDIAAAIVQHIHDRGGRFLKRVKMQGRGPTGHFCWYVLPCLLLLLLLLFAGRNLTPHLFNHKPTTTHTQHHDTGKRLGRNALTKRPVRRCVRGHRNCVAHWPPRRLPLPPCAWTALAVPGRLHHHHYRRVPYYCRSRRLVVRLVSAASMAAVTCRPARREMMLRGNHFAVAEATTGNKTGTGNTAFFLIDNVLLLAVGPENR
jgi:hypothetical protein